MLTIDNIFVSYGAVQALKGVSLEVAPGEVVALLGANGAGKSTLLRAVSGLIPLQSGSITYDRLRIDGLKPYSIARLGVIQCPEGRRIFANLTVLENLEIGACSAAANSPAPSPAASSRCSPLPAL